MAIKKKLRSRQCMMYLFVLLPVFVLLHLFFSRPVPPTSPFHDPILDEADNRIPLRAERMPLSELKYFTHNFANQGMGHKFSELVMGLHFANNNGLQYVFNERAFVRNFRNADLQWLGDLLRQRYPVPPELRAMMAANNRKAGIENHHSLQAQSELEDFDMVLNQWIPVYNYRDTAQFAYDQMGDYELRKSSLLGFGGRSSYMCPENNPRPNANCFLAGFSFFNASRDVQDLLQRKESTLREKYPQEHTIGQVDRLVIHIRLGDIQVSEKPETYVKVIQGMRRKLNISLPDENVHFVYFKPTELSEHMWGNWKRLRDIKSVLPNAQYHDIQSTEETLRFMVASKYLMTSGSSLSYVAAYFCPNCHVISAMPKEYIEDKIEMTEENYRNTFYYMDEWVPYIHYTSHSDNN
ncbi:hypothetical protein EMPS_01287 [Entomortierella parvispora]|uniref:Uncharacterized protein n=1 Tax=Entomortierella parvispora TaxID=205924 RepID=A0A9P3H2I9_9FUNG|nr:hypothetical protein EMPS_01287 [Entomortierella parvispora]